MDKLIEALQIFLKYKNVEFPTHCEHDVLFIVGFEEKDISSDDIKKLEELGFIWSRVENSFVSYRYGSA